MPKALDSTRAAPLNDADASKVARALSHPARVLILRIIGVGGACYCGDLCRELSLAQSTVSQHLKVLREAGLIRGTPCGTAVGYGTVPSRLQAYHAWAAALAQTEGIPMDAPPLGEQAETR